MLGYHRKNSVVVFLTVGDSVWSINIFSDARLRFSRPTQSLNIYVKFASADDRWWIGLGSIFIRASDEFCELNADIYDLTWHIISLCSLLGHTRSGIGRYKLAVGISRLPMLVRAWCERPPSIGQLRHPSKRVTERRITRTSVYTFLLVRPSSEWV